MHCPCGRGAVRQ
jgi:hypothetical protein